MSEDRLEKHRKSEKREDAGVFFQWLESNCHNAVSHEKLRASIKDKRGVVAKLIEES